MNCDYSRIKEACGVFGIYTSSEEQAANSIYYGLSSLQHRGQESCGIAVCDTCGSEGNLNVHRGMGLVHEVFDDNILHSLTGNQVRNDFRVCCRLEDGTGTCKSGS